MDPIRIGMINCDLHAMYYAALMEGYDPVELRDDTVGRGHAAYFYFHLCYADGRVRTAPTVGGFEIAKCWDADRTQAENMARIFNKKRGIACDTVEEVSDDVDLVFIADCNGEGHDHLEKAAPGLGKGVPTFVDKPFAYEYRDALRMLELAQASNTPVMSLSMVGDTDQSKCFRSRLKELGEPEFGVICGAGGSLAAHIHGIRLAQALFGTGFESVGSMGKRPLDYVHLDYDGKDGRPEAGVMLNCAAGGLYHCSMHASAYSKLGAIHSPNIGDFEFPTGAAAVLEMIKDMVRTGKAPVTRHDMIECIAVATAARLAHAERRRVCLAEVMQ